MNYRIFLFLFLFSCTSYNVVDKEININFETYNLDPNNIVGIITPDKDIIPDAENLSPAYLVYDNYELILKWNRSLRFALAVCTLKEKISNEL